MHTRSNRLVQTHPTVVDLFRNFEERENYKNVSILRAVALHSRPPPRNPVHNGYLHLVADCIWLLKTDYIWHRLLRFFYKRTRFYHNRNFHKAYLYYVYNKLFHFSKKWSKILVIIISQLLKIYGLCKRPSVLLYFF
jgi:hypothetical protein